MELATTALSGIVAVELSAFNGGPISKGIRIECVHEDGSKFLLYAYGTVVPDGKSYRQEMPVVSLHDGLTAHSIDVDQEAQHASAEQIEAAIQAGETMATVHPLFERNGDGTDR